MGYTDARCFSSLMLSHKIRVRIWLELENVQCPAVVTTHEEQTVSHAEKKKNLAMRCTTFYVQSSTKQTSSL